MDPIAPDRRTALTTKPSAADAARVALARPAPRRTPSRQRILRAATVLWCRDLQFPTVRAVARAAGLSSPSCVIAPFGRCVDVQAAIIRTEWELVTEGWAVVPDPSRPRWLAEHARLLMDLDPACLRLPGLVCSAVAAADGAALPPPDLLVPLHALGALAHPGAGDRATRAAAAAALADRTGGHPLAASA